MNNIFSTPNHHCPYQFWECLSITGFLGTWQRMNAYMIVLQSKRDNGFKNRKRDVLRTNG